ncbi:hypothetical protein BHU72_03785 [Desulfuribacillus stibiiarsenatis]|uniref:Peptidase C69 n=1 Tax=Desulfuribacillus stibiiarsenatis TaxID=1390249 RepID=A0A1E5L7A8_9FIRM|nr:TldD/PmbA family protein [Desulfuribacillus stibiiarsenatis]OEH85904.1 hypothetical protein BHU72_03785 [Desulfuribacillus stibiiarsenatis]
MSNNWNQWIEYALQKGAEEVEIIYEHSATNNIKVYEQKVEALTSATSKGVGIRVFIKKGMGFAYTSDLTTETIQKVVEEAIENATICPPDEFNGLPEKQNYQSIEAIYHENYKEISMEQKIKFLMDLEKQAKDYDSEITKVVQASFADQVTSIQLLNSKGFDGSFKSNYCYGGVYVAAERVGEMQTGGGMTFSRNFHQLDPDIAVQEACDTALILLGGKKIKSQKANIVFDKKVGMMFMYILANSLSADAVQKGRSLFKDKKNQYIASPLVSIIDDGLYEKGLATSPFDGEGVPSSTTHLIQNGVLKDYMYDTYTARKDKVRSTGNASRSYRSTPSLSTTNFYLENGTSSKQDIIGSVKNGFYVMEVSGLVTGGANPITGDFSVGATGRWIENGEFTTSVREVTIAGNIISMLKDIEMVGNDMEIIPIMGSFGCPTIKVNELAISGM